MFPPTRSIPMTKVCRRSTSLPLRLTSMISAAPVYYTRATMTTMMNEMSTTARIALKDKATISMIPRI